MARTFIASDPLTGRRDVVVEVRPDLPGGATGADLERFERRLDDRHIHAGLLVTPAKAHFVRDTYKRTDLSRASYEVRDLPTATLFSRTAEGRVDPGEGLYEQVKRWLDAVTTSWWAFVPDEALPMMQPEMLGGLAQAHIQELWDVLDAEE